MADIEKPTFEIPASAVEQDLEVPAQLEDVPPNSEQGRGDVNLTIPKMLADQHVEDMKAERKLRKKYAGLAFRFAVGGTLFWAALLTWSGCATYYTTKPPFSDNLLIAISTATSVNLFAAFLGVIRGLFPSNGKKP